MRGIIVKWNDEKGYGFIQIEGSKKEIFAIFQTFPKEALALKLMRRLLLN